MFQRLSCRGLPAATLALLCAALATACIRTPPPEDPDRFQRIDAAGAPLVDAATAHDCVFDRATQLTWLGDRPGDPLRDPSHRYSWYSSDRDAANGEPGAREGGVCALPPCNTETLVEAARVARFCGFDDWRLPSREESIMLGKRHGGSALGLHPKLFPHAAAGEYWTSTTFRLYPQSAWSIDPATGLDRADLKSGAKAVRLVRGTLTLPKRRS